MATRRKKLTAETIRKGLGHSPFSVPDRGRFDTGNKGLNGIFGSYKLGGLRIPTCIELTGQPSSGKSVLAIDLGATAQRQDFFVLFIDFEQSFDPEWAESRGLLQDEESFALFQPYLGKVGREREPRLITGEELLKEAETFMKELRKLNKRPFIILDSVAAILPEAVAGAEIDEQNRYTYTALSRLMSNLMPRWLGLIASCSGIGVFINQLREVPGVVYGDKWRSPGGNAVGFYSHIRVRMRRKGSDSGKMRDSGKIVGVKGIMTNKKNKAGGVEGAEIGYKIYFDGHSQFVKKESI